MESARYICSQHPVRLLQVATAHCGKWYIEESCCLQTPPALSCPAPQCWQMGLQEESLGWVTSLLRNLLWPLISSAWAARAPSHVVPTLFLPVIPPRTAHMGLLCWSFSEPIILIACLCPDRPIIQASILYAPSSSVTKQMSRSLHFNRNSFHFN